MPHDEYNLHEIYMLFTVHIKINRCLKRRAAFFLQSHSRSKISASYNYSKSPKWPIWNSIHPPKIWSNLCRYSVIKTLNPKIDYFVKISKNEYAAKDQQQMHHHDEIEKQIRKIWMFHAAAPLEEVKLNQISIVRVWRASPAMHRAHRAHAFCDSVRLRWRWKWISLE